MCGATGVTIQPHQILRLSREKTHILSLITYETSFTLRGATGVTSKPHQILRLSRKKTHILSPHHIWNLIYNALSNRCHHPTSPNTAPVPRKDSHTYSSSHMKPHFTMRGATGVTIQPHQILRLSREKTHILSPHDIWNVIYSARSNRPSRPTSPNTAPATQNCITKFHSKCPKTDETPFPMRGRSENDPRMIRAWSDHKNANRNPPRNRGYFSSSPRAFSIVTSADPGRRAQLLFLCSIQHFVTRCPSKIPSPKSKIQDPQNPKSKIQNPQNPKSPNSKIQTLHIKICYIMFQKSKIQNPQNPENPKSKIPKIQNPKSEIPKIQNPKFPKSKIQNPKSPQSKIQNPQNPKNPKSKIPKIQNPNSPKHPKSKTQNPQNPKIPKSKIQNPQNPKSPKSQNPKSPKSKIPNPQNPKSKIFRQNQKFGALGASRKELLHNDPKSKIQNPQNPAKKVWIFGFWGFWILDFGILVILDFGFWGFWILDFGILGFWGFWILDFGCFGDFGFWDFGDFGFWDFGDFGFWILGFWGGPGDVPLGNLVTVPGGQRLESPLVCLWGPLQNQPYRIELGQGSKLNIFQRSEPYKITKKNTWLPTQRSELYKITEKPRLPTQRSEPYKITEKTQTSNPEVRTLQNHRKNLDFQPTSKQI